MTITTETGKRANQDEPPTPPPLPSDEPSPGGRRLRPLTVAAVASLSAGAVHSAAIGSHAEHPAAARTFVAVTLVQIAWGSLALVKRSRVVALVGVVLNAALVGGWVLAKWKGLSFINGLDEVEPAQFADTLCAALALVSGLAAAAVYLQFRPRRAQPWLPVAAVAVLAVVALPGMVEAGRHVHAGTLVAVKTRVRVIATADVPTKPYNPKTPIDLSGVKGVSLPEEARAENVVADTVIRLPNWSDPNKAKASGYSTFGASTGGIETLTNWSYINDGKDFDAARPEALVYEVKKGRPTLVSAIYMLKPGTTVQARPKLGGRLTPWDVRGDLCLAGAGKAAHLVGLARGGTCTSPAVKLAPVAMMHVWTVAHPCGPFAWNPKGAGTIRTSNAKPCVLEHQGAGL